ncbi:hypothetical protein BKA61DRAFT_470762 [Leptodontidium sp. MPI-SDFR-AT-0119]|nr:hypothetical protein BKA61DRAFT_470762 [Leptodontidium sp. MPI-SDFR-AT-0119]
MARSIGLFQGLVALPALFILGEWALISLFETNIPIYDFITSTFNSIFAAGILFVLVVQHNITPSPAIILYFEVAKSGLATAVWLWLLLDSIFGPNRSYQRPPRGPRIARAGISVIVLLILFYPTLVYAKMEEKRSRAIEVDTEADQVQTQAEEDRGEREPLLG